MNIISRFYWKLYLDFLDFKDWLFSKKKLTEMEKKIKQCEEFRTVLKKRSFSCSPTMFPDRVEVKMNSSKLRQCDKVTKF